MNPSDLSAWYKKRPIILWVEDPLTRTYLRALWADPDISFLVGGGNDAVVAAVRDARMNGEGNVFGFRDRDFLESNTSDWYDPNKQPHVFRPIRHEIENYLIRPDILAVLDPNLNPQGRTEADLHERALAFATTSLWWMVCRAVIHDANREVIHQFPIHPSWGSRNLLDAASARTHLEQALSASTWGQGVATWVSDIRATWISDRMEIQRKFYQAALDGGSWPEIWSGKDIFKELAGHVNTGKRKAVAADELAKAIGGWQNQNERTGELWDLHAILRWRAGRAPQPKLLVP